MITIDIEGAEADLKVWKFPTGEVGVKCEAVTDENLPADSAIVIRLDWESNDDLMALAQLKELIDSHYFTNVVLLMPYVPYSRQDRRCHPGEALALKVLGNFINSLNFAYVMIADPHSYVCENVINRARIVTQEEIVGRVMTLLPNVKYVIAPDAGASKKIFNLAAVKEGKVEVIVADKLRSKNGEVFSVKLPDALYELTGQEVLVVDDICDGGATFLELGREIRRYYPGALRLYVTHGFFTKGYAALTKVYDSIHVKCNYNKQTHEKVIQL